MSFRAFCKKHHINPEGMTASDLEKIKTACLQDISQDFTSKEDTPEAAFKAYSHFIESYFSHFLPHIRDNLAQSVNAFKVVAVDWNAIQYATYQGYDRFLSQLKDIPPEIVNQPDSYGMRPLHLAAVRGNFHTAQALLTKGADPSLTNLQHQTPAFSAVEVSLVANKLNHEKIFELLYAQCPEVIMQHDVNGNTICHRLAVHGFKQILQKIITHHPHVLQQQNERGEYPIHVAILNNQEAMVKLLLEHDPAQVNLVDLDGRTPLHYAANYSNKAIVELCCTVSDNVNPHDYASQTPWMLANRMGNQEAMAVLQRFHADENMDNGRQSRPN